MDYAKRRSILGSRIIYHATPLHYLPSILSAGELLSQRIVGYDKGRPTARRRDRALQVDQYVHFSLTAITPLLLQKLQYGYPHVVFEISPDDLGVDGLSILPCSTKAWRAKWQCQPVTESSDIVGILNGYDTGHRFQGLEVLVKDRLLLPEPTTIITHSEYERSLAKELCNSFRRNCNDIVRMEKLGSSNETSTSHLETITDYFNVCNALERCLPPPKLPFD